MEYLLWASIVGLSLWGSAALRGSAVRKRARAEERTKRERAAAMTAEAVHFVEEVNRCRRFPEVAAPELNFQSGEFAILRAAATIFEMKSRRVTIGVGTRVRVGKMPIYLGASESSPYEVQTAAGNGDILLTNKRLIFMSPARSTVLRLPDIIGLGGTLDSFTLHSAKRGKPQVFAVQNPALWLLLVKIAASHVLESPHLPDGMTFRADANGDELHFAASATDRARLA